jgi:hypothetical protein
MPILPISRPIDLCSDAITLKIRNLKPLFISDFKPLDVFDKV